MKIYVGIDNGLLGGLGAVQEDGEIVFCMAMPVLKQGKGRVIDIKGVWDALRPFQEENQLVVIIEEAAKHSPGTLALCSTWFTYGHLCALMALKGIRHEVVQPQKWQKMFWVKPAMPKSEKFDTKAAALVAAKKLWPAWSFLATNKSTVPHDGIIDSLLLGEYGRRNNL